MEEDNIFLGKVCLITGSSKGIGAGIAIHLAALGASISITGRDEKSLEAVKNECLSEGHEETKVLVTVGDVSDDKFLESLMEKTIEYFGKLDCLVNNAAIAVSASVQSANIMEAFDKNVAVNLRPYYILSRLAVPHLEETKGSIVNISSGGSRKPEYTVTPYCMVKAGIDHFTRCLAVELCRKGIRVNTINPGGVDTSMLQSITPSSLSYQQFLDMIGPGFHLLGRVGESKDIAQGVAYLASEKATWITGSNLIIDGGFQFTGIALH